jgi:hypothetical protein
MVLLKLNFCWLHNRLLGWEIVGTDDKLRRLFTPNLFLVMDSMQSQVYFFVKPDFTSSQFLQILEVDALEKLR